jgi:5-formyltetrahydrofolate cyclo-ligase
LINNIENKNNKKSIFRKNCIKTLQKSSKNIRLKKIREKQISNNLEKLLNSLEFETILFYLPLYFEVNLLKIIKIFRQKNKKVFVPYILNQQKQEQENIKVPFKANKFRLPISNLKTATNKKKSKNKFGILEANYSSVKTKKIDIMVVPVIGIDKHFKRIGFGKGMYDQFYSSLQNKPLLIFIQITKCSTSEELSEPHDIKADYYITFNELLKIRGSKNDTNRNNHLREYRFNKWSSKHDFHKRIH